MVDPRSERLIRAAVAGDRDALRALQRIALRRDDLLAFEATWDRALEAIPGGARVRRRRRALTQALQVPDVIAWRRALGILDCWRWLEDGWLALAEACVAPRVARQADAWLAHIDCLRNLQTHSLLLEALSIPEAPPASMDALLESHAEEGRIAAWFRFTGAEENHDGAHDVRDALWLAARVSDVDWSGSDLRGARLIDCGLQRVVLRDADLRGVTLRGCTLRHVDLRGARLEGARIERCCFDADTRWPEDLDLRTLDALGPGAGHPGQDARRLEFFDVGIRQMNLEGVRLEGAALNLEAEAPNAAVVSRSGALVSGGACREGDYVGVRLPWRLDLPGVQLTHAECAWALFDETDLRGAALRRADLFEARLAGTQLYDADLSEADLEGARLLMAVGNEGTSFRGANLAHADLIQSELGGVDMRDACLRCARLEGADFSEARLEGADLSLAVVSEKTRWPAGFDPSRHRLLGPASQAAGADLRGHVLRHANLEGAHLEGCVLMGVDLRCAHLGRADLRGADLRRARLRDTDLRHADLRGADLRAADLQWLSIGDVERFAKPCWGADLRGADLRDATLSGAHLEGALFDAETQWPADFHIAASRALGPGGCMDGATLSELNLTGFALEGVSLRGARLTRALCFDVDLRGAILDRAECRETRFRGATLSHASIRGADLRGACLRGVQLEGASVQGARFEGAVYDAKTTWPEGVEARLLGALGPGAHLDGLDVSSMQSLKRIFPIDGLDLRRASLVGARLDGLRFCEIDLREADLRQASLRGVTFKQRLSMRGPGARLEGANLEGADLHGVDWCFAAYDDQTRWPAGFDPTGCGALGPNAQLQGADLLGIRAAGVDLRGADLRGANLLSADLRGAHLAGCDLRGADLRTAKLNDHRGVPGDLRGCRMDGASLLRSAFSPAQFIAWYDAGLIIEDLELEALPAALLEALESATTS